MKERCRVIIVIAIVMVLITLLISLVIFLASNAAEYIRQPRDMTLPVTFSYIPNSAIIEIYKFDPISYSLKLICVASPQFGMSGLVMATGETVKLVMKFNNGYAQESVYTAPKAYVDAYSYEVDTSAYFQTIQMRFYLFNLDGVELTFAHESLTITGYMETDTSMHRYFLYEPINLVFTEIVSGNILGNFSSYAFPVQSFFYVNDSIQMSYKQAW